ncbi:MAG: AbrB/MazE/SpoVT family DNA-binding domain-containing protein [Gemmatimonadetes bacterium]|nr:AbrB/MazE/SpoVT family DNA-binding domain-containing protein [Gemmatimonadota bacterium]
MIPPEAAMRMKLKPGDTLYWIEDPAGGYRVSPENPLLRAHDDVMREYGGVFESLAKGPEAVRE